MKQLIESYASGYELLNAAIAGLSDEAVRFKPSPASWSVQEIIVHLADTEMVLMHRMKSVLSEDKPLLTVFDQNLWAERMNYASLDYKLYLSLFKLLRESFVPVLELVAEQDMNRAGIHTEVGKITFRELLQKCTDHLNGHLGQIERVVQAYRSK